MKMCFNSLRVCLIITGLASGWVACTDTHTEDPVIPLKTQSRIKTIEDVTLGETITYAYDSQNRPASFSVSDGSRGAYVYDDSLKRYTELTCFYTGQAYSKRTRFPYQQGSKNFSVNTYLLSAVQNHLLETMYTLDSAKQLTGAYSNGSGVVTSRTYVSQDQNVVSSSVVQVRSRVRYTYTFDTNANPFKGLVGPTFDPFDAINYFDKVNLYALNEIVRFSRNNITKTTNIDTGQITTCTYTYNSAKLPVTLTFTNDKGNHEYHFTYESY